MKKLFIPPVFLLLSIGIIPICYFFVEDCNIINFPLNLLGILFIIIAISITGKTRDLFKKHKTTLNIEKSSSMITEGPFARTRNPMYIGMILLLTGLACLSGNVLALLSPLAFFVCISIFFIPKEEKLMLEVFGKDYLEYKQKVRRWI